MAKLKSVEAPDLDGIASVINLLGGSAVFPSRPKSPLAAHLMIKKGLPSGALTHLLASMAVLTDQSALQTALGMSHRTVQRKRESEAILNVSQSGRTWKFAEVLAKAIDVFGDKKEAERWLDEPAIGLEGYRPIELLSTPAGVEVVETFLDRLEYGVYA